MKNIVGILVFAVISIAFTQDAMALPQFKKAFGVKYAAKHKSKEFQAAVKKASCNVCHVKGPKKTVQNEYGKMLNKLIEGEAAARKKKAKTDGGPDAEKKELAKILAELEKAFDKVGEAKSDGGKGPKYSKLIKEGKLPVDPAKAAAAYKAKKKKEGGEEETEIKDEK